jgi:hypothetical protein
MKKTLILLAFISCTAVLAGQENMFSLSGGYSFCNVEDIDVNSNGWRINGLYEFNPHSGKIAHGFSFGYVNNKAEGEGELTDNTYKISTMPIYYAPKFLIGSEKIKGFIKGAIGMQRSWLKREGTLGSVENKDFGFAGGGGAGGTLFINEKIFLNLEYELLWLSNSWYKDGLLNTASLGLGMRF